MEYNTERCKNIKISIDNRDRGIHGTEDLLIDLFHYMLELYKSGVAINMVELDMLVNEDKGEPLNYPKPNITIKEYSSDNTDKEKDEKAERALRELNEFLEDNVNKMIQRDSIYDVITKISTLYVEAFRCTTDHILFQLDDINFMDINKLLIIKKIPYRIKYIPEIQQHEIIRADENN